MYEEFLRIFCSEYSRARPSTACVSQFSRRAMFTRPISCARSTVTVASTARPTCRSEQPSTVSRWTVNAREVDRDQSGTAWNDCDWPLASQRGLQLGVAASAGSFEVAWTRGDGYVLPRTRHSIMMMVMLPARHVCGNFASLIHRAFSTLMHKTQITRLWTIWKKN